MHAGSKAEV